MLVVGILGLLCCGVLAPVAWKLGNRSMRYDQEHAGLASAGRILGIVGTAYHAVLAPLTVLSALVR